jgi:hypothetical protein
MRLRTTTSPSRTTAVGSTCPTERIAAYGGLTIAVIRPEATLVVSVNYRP